MLKPFLAPSVHRRRVLKHLASDSYRPSHGRGIARELGLSVSVVQKTLASLEEAGFVTLTPAGKRVVVAVNRTHPHFKDIPRVVAELEAEEAAQGEETRRRRRRGRSAARRPAESQEKALAAERRKSKEASDRARAFEAEIASLRASLDSTGRERDRLEKAVARLKKDLAEARAGSRKGDTGLKRAGGAGGDGDLRELKCAGCGTILGVHRHQAKKQARCPVCGRLTSIPDLWAGGSAR